MNSPEVVSLEVAKKLKTNGYSEPTEYYWLDKDLPFCPKGLYRVKDKFGGVMNNNAYDEFIYSAPYLKDI